MDRQFRIVIALSDLLNETVDKYTIARDVVRRMENHSTGRILAPHPVVILGDFDVGQGIKDIFMDCLQRVPDVCVAMGGQSHASNELKEANRAGIPVIPIPIIEGVAKNAKCTLAHELLDEYQNSIKETNAPLEIAKAVISLIEAQVALMERKTI